jgi:hypothetical protein
MAWGKKAPEAPSPPAPPELVANNLKCVDLWILDLGRRMFSATALSHLLRYSGGGWEGVLLW